MDISEVLGLNVKYYRHKKHLTQEQLAERSPFKLPYISLIERGCTNLTIKNVQIIADCLKIDPYQLFVMETAKEAKKLPKRVDFLE